MLALDVYIHTGQTPSAPYSKAIPSVVQRDPEGSRDYAHQRRAGQQPTFAESTDG